MQRGHSFWPKRREWGGVIDLHELFINYWSSKNQDFTVLSQSIITNQSHRADRTGQSLLSLESIVAL